MRWSRAYNRSFGLLPRTRDEPRGQHGQTEPRPERELPTRPDACFKKHLPNCRSAVLHRFVGSDSSCQSLMESLVQLYRGEICGEFKMFLAELRHVVRVLPASRTRTHVILHEAALVGGKRFRREQRDLFLESRTGLHVMALGSRPGRWS